MFPDQSPHPQPSPRLGGEREPEAVSRYAQFHQFGIAVFLFLPAACCFNVSMSSSNDVFDSAAPDIYEIKTSASGPAGSLPLTEDMLLNSPSGDLFGLTQNVGMGWNRGGIGRQTISHSKHARRIARAGWQTDRARLSHRPLGNRIARPGGGGRISQTENDSVRRILFRPVRWPDAGHDGNVRQPAVSQRRRDHFSAARALAAAARGSARHRDVRQRFARDDDGRGRPA